MNNAVAQRCWQDHHTGRFWYDAPTNGYYMRPNEPGLRRDDDAPVKGFEVATVPGFAAFVSLVRSIVLANPTKLF